MAEQTSREASRLASSTYGYKMQAASSGKVRASVITGPDTVTWAQNDTCGNRDMIPAGSRFIGAFVSNAAGGSSVTMSVGIRAWTPDGTGAAIDAAGIVSALAVTSAASVFSANGTYAAAGAESVTTVPSEPYFTLAAAVPTANADFRVTVLYIAP
jgi:predicted phage tail protein